MSIENSQQGLTADSMVWQHIFFPQPLPESAVSALLRQWAAQRHAPQLILEARADVVGVDYLIGSQLRHAAAVARTIEQLVPGSVVTKFYPDERGSVTTARRLSLDHPGRPLEPTDRVASGRAILHALTAVHRGERLVLQLVLGPRHRPSVPAAEPVKLGQSPVSKLLVGVQSESPHDRQTLLRKLGQHGFLASVRLGVHATTEERRKVLLLGLATALGTVEAPGVHFRLAPEKERRINRPRPTWALFTRSIPLGVSEVAVLTGWPISDSDEPFPGQPPRHPKPMRPSAAVQSGERVLATANAPGSSDATIGYNVTDALRHSWIVGPNGVGKSTLLLNLIVQDLEAGRPVVVIEPKDLVNDILARIPVSRRDDVVVLDPLDNAPVGLNPMARSTSESSAARSPELIADSMFGTLSALYGDSLGPRSADILRNCLDVLSRRDDASLVMVPLLFSNPGFRRSLTQHAMRDDPFSSGPFWQWFESLSPEAAATVVAPLANKLRPLLGRQLRAVLAQQTPRFDIRQVLTERKILLVPLQRGVLGPEVAQLLGALVVASLWDAIRERVSIPEAEREPVMVYIDEVQDYLKLPTDLGDVLATARSLRCGMHLAHQFQMQLPKPMLDAFRNNARSRIAFQLASGDARDMAAGQSALTAEDFGALPAHHIYAQLVRDNSVQPWASGVTLPPPPITSDPDDIRQRSRTRYGQPLGDIEAGFADLLDHAHQPEQQTPTAGHGRKARRP